MERLPAVLASSRWCNCDRDRFLSKNQHQHQRISLNLFYSPTPLIPVLLSNVQLTETQVCKCRDTAAPPRVWSRMLLSRCHRHGRATPSHENLALGLSVAHR